MLIHIAAQPATGTLVLNTVPFTPGEIAFCAEQGIGVMTWDTDEHEQLIVDCALGDGPGTVVVITEDPHAAA